MSKTRDTGFLGNVVKVDASGNVSFVSGSTTLATINTTGQLSGSSPVLSASYASNAETLDGLDSTVFTLTSSFNAQTASFTAFSSSINSFSASQNSFTASILAQTASLNTFSASVLTYQTNLNLKTASFATTGSNDFTAVQHIADTTNPTGFDTTASLYTEGGLGIKKDSYFSSSLYIKGNLTVYGTQSVNYITSSQLNISTNIITVNTSTPSIRFGGLAVQDSGSAGGLTGSLLWDSQNNSWLYNNPSGSGNYDSSLVIMGPRNSSTLGNEVGLSCNYLVQGHGHHHTTSSAIFHDGSTTCIGTGMSITSAGASCFANNVCALNLVSRCNIRIGVDGGYAVISGPTTGAAISLGSNSSTFDRNLSLGIVGGDLSFSPILTINAQTGNVGIGDCTPDRRLYVADTSVTQGTLLAYNRCTTFCGTVIEGITDRTSNSAFNLMNLKASTTSMLLIRGDGLACFAGQVCIGSNLVIAGSGGSSGILLPSTSNILGLVAGTSYSENVPRIEISGVAFDSCSSAANNVYIRANTVRFTLANASCETMRITSAGNVGIGASSPQQILSVNNPFSSLNALYPVIISQTGNAEIGGMYSTADSITNPIGAGLAFKTYQVNVGLTEKIRITHAGYMGIGCTAPSGKLQVVNSSTQYAIYTLGGNLELHTPEGNCGYVRLGSAYNLNGVYGSCGLNYIAAGTSNHIFYTTDSVCERMRITSGGNVGIGTTCPSGTGIVLNAKGITGNTVSMVIAESADAGSMVSLYSGASSADHPSLIYLRDLRIGSGNKDTTGYVERMRITSTGIATFTCQVCAPMFISTAGCVVSNSVITYAVGGTMAGATATYFDFPTWNDTSQGQMFEIKAFFDHFYNWNYGAHYYVYLTTREGNSQALTMFNCTTANGGSWMAYKTSPTNLRVCKVAGSYSGGGAYWIQVTAKQP